MKGIEGVVLIVFAILLFLCFPAERLLAIALGILGLVYFIVKNGNKK